MEWTRGMDPWNGPVEWTHEMDPWNGLMEWMTCRCIAEALYCDSSYIASSASDDASAL